MPKDSMVRFCHINTLSMELDARINESVLIDNESVTLTAMKTILTKKLIWLVDAQ